MEDVRFFGVFGIQCNPFIWIIQNGSNEFGMEKVPSPFCLKMANNGKSYERKVPNEIKHFVSNTFILES